MITVKYELSQEAQKVELAAGRSGERVRTIVLEFPYPVEALRVASIREDGHGELDMTKWRGLQIAERTEYMTAYWEKGRGVSGHGQGTWREVADDYKHIYFPALLTVDFLVDFLRERAAQCATLEAQATTKEQAQLEARVAAEAALAAKIPAAEAEFAAKDAREAAELVESARQQAEEEQLAGARQSQRLAWAKKGTQNQQQRLAAGLLNNEEIDSCIEAEAFAALDGFNPYKKLRRVDFCECDYDSQVTFSAEATKSVTAEQWDRLEEIRKVILVSHPSAMAMLRKHEGSCQSCEKSAERFGVQVKLQVGALKFVREYAAD